MKRSERQLFFCSYTAGDLKERIHLFCCSDAQPCRMTHNQRHGCKQGAGSGRPNLYLLSQWLRRVAPLSSPNRRFSLVRRRVEYAVERSEAQRRNLHRGTQGRGGRGEKKERLICQICVRDETALTFSRAEQQKAHMRRHFNHSSWGSS